MKTVSSTVSSKEGKHPWHLGHFPKRTEAAVVVHGHFTLLVMGLCTAFRLWQAQQASKPTTPEVGISTALLGGEGTAGFRQRLKEENRDHVIVFLEDAYGLFHLAELAVLSGLRLRRLPTPLGSVHPTGCATRWPSQAKWLKTTLC